MRPAKVNLYNAGRARENFDKRARSNYRSRHRARPHRKFDVGDHVRLSWTKNTFERGYEKNFCEEIFKIIRVSLRQGLYTYVLVDLNGEIIDGFFYNEELVLVGRARLSDDKTFKIERIVRTKGRGANK